MSNETQPAAAASGTGAPERPIRVLLIDDEERFRRNLQVAELVTDHSSVAIDAPLIEAIHLLVTRRLINLPVMRGGELVGLLRDKDLLLEVAEAVLGDARSSA